MALQAQASAVLDLPASANRSAQRLLAALGAAGTLSGTDALLAVESHVRPVAIPTTSSASAPGRAHTPAATKSGSRTTAPDVPTQLDLRARLFPWQTQPIASAQAQSTVYIMFDMISTNPADFNHVPGGSNILYMDGHVAFMRYQEKGEGPVNGPMAQLVGLLNGG